MRGHKLWGFGILALGVIGLTVWIDAFIVSRWSGELFRGIGVEVIGALITAFGVIGLDRLYTEPDAEVQKLRDEVKLLHAKMDRLHCQLDTLADRSTSAPPLPFSPDQL